MPLLVALGRAAEGPAPRRRAFALGACFGFVFYVLGLHWIARLSNVAITVPWLKYPGWLLAAGYLALFPALATSLAVALARRRGGGLAWTFPPALLLIEELRASGELGFPWFQPGYTQQGFAPILQLASLGSVTLVTLWLACLNVLVWRSFAGRARARAAAGALLLLLLPWFWGRRVLDAADYEATRAPARPVVALVQGNIASEIKWAGTHQKQILATFLALSRDAAVSTPRPALVIWPETATGSYLRKQLDQAFQVAAFAHDQRVPVFSGFADVELDSTGTARHTNSAGLFEPDGSIARTYAKRHLVPFGERMTFQSLIPALGRLELGQAEWTPGRRSVLFPSAAGPFACLVCFEAIFPDLARADVRAGARWLVNVTNDEWFGNGAALHQHAAMAVFRAVENHVPLARCANTGLTMFVDANGRVTARLPVWRPGVLRAPLPAPGLPTPYTRLGDWPAWLAFAVLVVAPVVGMRGHSSDG